MHCELQLGLGLGLVYMVRVLEAAYCNRALQVYICDSRRMGGGQRTCNRAGKQGCGRKVRVRVLGGAPS